MNFFFKNLSITYIGSAVPKDVVNLYDFANLYGETTVKKIIDSTGISKIRVAPKDITTSDLCEAAFKKIQSENNLDVNSIDALIFVSQTPDYILPQTSNVLQNKLGLNQETVCFDIPLGCSGYIYGLLQAALLISSGCKKVLLLAGDTTTKLINSNDRTVSMVFGDAGTATIIERGINTLNVSVRSDGSGSDKLIVPAGGFRCTSNFETQKVIEVEKGVFRSKDDLYMDGLAIMNFAITEVPKMIHQTLVEVNWKPEDVGCFVLHQANAFMLNYLRKKMKLPIDKVPIAVDGYGNTGPASIPLLLCDKASELSYNNQLEKLVLCGFGVGLSWGSACLNLSSTKIYKPIVI